MNKLLIVAALGASAAGGYFVGYGAGLQRTHQGPRSVAPTVSTVPAPSPPANAPVASAPQPAVAAPSQPVASPPPPPESKWRYSGRTDPMSGKAGMSASIASENMIELGFPYQGKQFGTLLVRNDPRLGRDIMFRVFKGQITCSSYSCPITVRFDDGNPQTVHGNESADHDSTVVFLEGYDRLVSQMAKAKLMRIEIQFYQEGLRVFEFDVRDFDANKLKTTSS